MPLIVKRGAWHDRGLGARENRGTGGGRGKSERLEFLKGGMVRNKGKVRLFVASPVTMRPRSLCKR